MKSCFRPIDLPQRGGREREKERETGRQTDRQTDRDRDRQMKTERFRD